MRLCPVEATSELSDGPNTQLRLHHLPGQGVLQAKRAPRVIGGHILRPQLELNLIIAEIGLHRGRLKRERTSLRPRHDEPALERVSVHIVRRWV
jgi:hypothetical protein